MELETFGCIFFNGHSSVAYHGTVSMMEDNLIIAYEDENLVRQTATWNISGIKGEPAAGKNLVLKYGTFPYQILEIDDPFFSEAYKRKYNSTLSVGSKNVFANFSTAKAIVFTLVFLVLAGCVWFFALPYIAGEVALRIPFETEKLLGDQLDIKFSETYETDSAASVLVNQFFAESDMITPLSPVIRVIKGKEINAFALPGGYIYIFEGLLTRLDQPEQLAALLAHECSHIELKHTTRSIIRNLSGYIFISIILGDVSGFTAIIIQNAENLKSLQYSRKLEEEADVNGLKLMLDAGVNPYGMIRLLEKLRDLKEDAPAEIISSHPLIEKRIKYIYDEINRKKIVPEHKPMMEDTWKKIMER